MTLAISIDDDAVKRVAAIFRTAPDLVVSEITTGIYEASLYLQREVAERTPTSGAGTLRSSILARQPQIGDGAISGTVGTPMVYALPVELGTRPHHPPVQPLIDWVEMKLGLTGKKADAVARAIAWKIAKHGTQGAHMFRDALEAGRVQIGEILSRHARRALARIKGGGA